MVPGVRTFSLPKLSRSPLVGDLVVVLVVGSALYVAVHFGLDAPEAIQGPEVSLAGWALPYYAVRSLLRMTLAYVLSIGFTLVYGSLAARSKRAELVLLPVLDVLQSVPILAFLPVVLLGLTAILPAGVAVELAAVVLIFTSQVWNLTFSYYQSLRTVPGELREASAVFRLGGWLRFTRLNLPFASIGLLWNSVMAWAGGWFFLMAAEIFTVGDRDFRLPGLGSYLQVAADRGDVGALTRGVVTLVGMIVALDQLVWRPALAWAERFKMSQVGEEEAESSWFLGVLRRSRLARGARARAGVMAASWGHALNRPPKVVPPLDAEPTSRRTVLVVVAIAGGTGVVWALFRAVGLLLRLDGGQWSSIALGAGATLVRVTVAVAIAVAWTVPVGVLIGTNRTAARLLRPITQIAASVPATAFFPILLLFLLGLPAGANLAAVVLMLLGTQWYILFNVIAATSAIPQDLIYTTELLGLRGWQRWKNLILPAVFPFIITGLITASGGAWNASIVAEYTIFGGQVHQVTGLGALITEATGTGDFPLLLASTLTMIVLVVTINRLVWRRLYRIAEQRYRLDQ
jgi:NitT/TauT family transport system permease protein